MKGPRGPRCWPGQRKRLKEIEAYFTPKCAEDGNQRITRSRKARMAKRTMEGPFWADPTASRGAGLDILCINYERRPWTKGSDDQGQGDVRLQQPRYRLMPSAAGGGATTASGNEYWARRGGKASSLSRTKESARRSKALIRSG